MDRFHPEVAAAVLAAELTATSQSVIDPATREYCAVRIEALLRTAMRAERQACADLCVERQRLWETTGNRPGTFETMRAECRFRSNEAAYLADALREPSAD